MAVDLAGLSIGRDVTCRGAMFGYTGVKACHEAFA